MDEESPAEVVVIVEKAQCGGCERVMVLLPSTPMVYAVADSFNSPDHRIRGDTK
jgi:hypothetical protein